MRGNDGRLISLPGQQAWLNTHVSAYRSRVADDPFATALLRAAFRPRWLAGFLTPPPDHPDATFTDELGRVRATPPEVARRDLSFGTDAPLPPELRVSDLPSRTADLLAWVWTRTVEPDWSRWRRLFEADILARRRPATGQHLRPSSGRPGGRSAAAHPVQHPAGVAQLGQAASLRGGVPLLRDTGRPDPRPTTTRAEPPTRSGPRVHPHPAGLPEEPTQLVALTGYGFGSVGGHLNVLLQAQLIGRRRSGRSVLYFRTPSGDLLVELQSASGPVDRGHGPHNLARSAGGRDLRAGQRDGLG